MRRLLLIAAALLALLAPARESAAQLMGGGFIAKKPAPTSSYVGPGDVVSGWAFWGGLRAFSGATAGTKAANICNSGDANCADVNTLANGNFDVATATGAPLNCGGTGGTCTVKTLYDKSGNARDITQATAANRPTLTFSCLGSLPCMTGSTTAILTNGVNLSQAQPWSAMAVIKNTSATTQFQAAINDGNANGIVRTNSNAGQASCFTAAGSIAGGAGTLTDDVWHDEECVANGVSSSLTVDNGSAITGNLGATSLSFPPTMFGNGFGQNNQGKIAEGGLLTSGLSTGNITSLSANAQAYWGL
jgi:hypothetical protein